MRYKKCIGSVYETFYAVDVDNLVCNQIELRYTCKDKIVLETAIVSQHSGASYDRIATGAVINGETAYLKEWNASKKAVSDFTKGLAKEGGAE